MGKKITGVRAESLFLTKPLKRKTNILQNHKSLWMGLLKVSRVNQNTVIWHFNTSKIFTEHFLCESYCARLVEKVKDEDVINTHPVIELTPPSLHHSLHLNPS